MITKKCLAIAAIFQTLLRCSFSTNERANFGSPTRIQPVRNAKLGVLYNTKKEQKNQDLETLRHPSTVGKGKNEAELLFLQPHPPKRRNLREMPISVHQSVFEVKKDFVDVCYNTLTSNQVVVNGNITTSDVHDFMVKISDRNEGLTFEGLDVEIQLHWMWTLCPNTMWRVSASVTTECYDDLERMNENESEYGFILTPETKDLIFLQIKDFCGRIWFLFRTIGEFHEIHRIILFRQNNPNFCRQSNSSMFSDNTAPPTAMQYLSNGRSDSLYNEDKPSLQPSYRNSFSVEFKYVIGLYAFKDLNPIRLAVDTDGFQTSSKQALRRILSDFGISTKQRNPSSRILQLRELIAFEELDPANSIYFTNVTEVPCSPMFVQSSSCVFLDTELRISADPMEYSEDIISSKIRSQIKDSMETSLFLDTLKRSEVNEVLFIDSTYLLWNETIESDDSETSVSHNMVVTGISIGASLLLAVAILVSRSRVRDDRSDIDTGEKIDYDSFREDESMEHNVLKKKHSFKLSQLFKKPSDNYKQGNVSNMSHEHKQNHGLEKKSENVNAVQFDSELGDAIHRSSPKIKTASLESKTDEASKTISWSVRDFMTTLVQQSSHRSVPEESQTRGNYSDLCSISNDIPDEGKSLEIRVDNLYSCSI
jgi:hypothetical protein